GASNDGIIHSNGGNFTTLGGFDVTLNNLGNDFGNQAVNVNATAPVSLTDTNASGLVLGKIRFGSGFSATADGPVTQSADGFLHGRGAVSVTKGLGGPAAGINVALTNAANNVTGGFLLTNANNVAVTNQGDINLGGSAISTSGNVVLNAGGAVLLPTTTPT